METKHSHKKSQEYYCVTCDYSTSRYNDYSKHILTRKHILSKEVNTELTKVNTNVAELAEKPKKMIECNCGKTYTSRVGLWKHKKLNKCINKNYEKESSIANELILKIFEGNNNLVTKLANDNTELQNIIKEMLKTGLTNSQLILSVFFSNI